ncbi:nucleoside phosphatase family-domain-containing protein [Epithele typhae]|uniref:nucleoside phosphatase family-domain-containing protein n=1 Tax=Epithele typhae TaxID=378194 RepID=UPI0020089439|nr:nucleoside phosphatase family-domain-containing protein [Epithele typhae]KAH9912853.1 nucleoside phosphatase family-domain-containing protein [Epithele typhae]
MFSPRSSNYERLEGGMGPGRSASGRRFGWKKFALGAVVVIAVVYFFGPRREDLGEYVPGDYQDIDLAMPPPGHPTTTKHTGTPVRPPHDDDMAPEARPTDPVSDGDLTKTHFCTKPYKPDLPLVQFALMIDAGSTGSRIHIYKFNNCGPSPAYEYEVFKMLQPGLSSFRDSPRGAAESLDPLLEEAKRVVPASLQKCTPVAVKATAGLRQLGTKESGDILAAVRQRLRDYYPFSLQGGDEAVTIMEGADEGVYAWLTANYLLKTLAKAAGGEPPYAVLDLGGASTQIVFEPTFDMAKPDAGLADGEHKYALRYDGGTRTLYQHSYLGYGLKTARQSVHRVVEFMSSLRGLGHGKDAEVTNPCLAQTTSKLVEIEDERLGGQFNVTMVGKDVGSFDSCNRVVELVMAKDAICSTKPCSFNGVYQPSLIETFPHGKILLLSYFFDRLSPFMETTAKPLKAPIHISTFAEVAKTVCEGPKAWKERWGSDKALMEELEGRPEWCLDLTFQHALLRLGYELGGEREVQLGKQIDGTELGWCLGATIAMVTGSKLECKV